MLADLGGERLTKVATGDELCGQEQSFGNWAKSVFEIACDVFCIGDELNLTEVMKSATLKPMNWSIDYVKLEPTHNVTPNTRKGKQLILTWHMTPLCIAHFFGKLLPIY